MAGALGLEPRMAVSKTAALPLPAVPQYYGSDISYIIKIKQFSQWLTRI